MKKIALILSVIMMLSFVSCSKSDVKITEQTIDQAAQEKAEAEAKAKAEAEAKAKAEAEKKKSDKYDQATRLLKQGKYDEAITLFTELDEYKDSKDCAIYATALTYCEIGDYESAYIELTKIPNYENSIPLLAHIYYETRLFEILNDFKKYLKNPDSLIVKDVVLTYEDTTGMTSTKEKPAFILQISAQNGFGGYTSSYVLGNYDDSSKKYTYVGSCDSLDTDDYTADELLEWLTAYTINNHLENPEIENAIDIDRVTTIVSKGKYSSIKSISELTFDQFSDDFFDDNTSSI